MSSWNPTPNGISAMIYGRRCEVIRRIAPKGSTSGFRAHVQGLESSALRNNGYAKDYAEGKDICFEALAAAGLAPNRHPAGGGGTSKYAPHPFEIRARMLEAAIGLVNGLGLPDATTNEGIARRLGQVKTVASHLEMFVYAATKESTAQAVAAESSQPSNEDLKN